MTDEIKALAQELKDKLKTGSTNFTFKKKDGTVRKAVGTTNTELIPEGARPLDKPIVEGVEIKETAHQNYFDLEKGAWRSLQKESLISVDN